jgi:methionine aminopeptidase
MPITIKDEAGIAAMREACRLAAEVLDSLTPHVQPGITTLDIDRLSRPGHGGSGHALGHHRLPAARLPALPRRTCAPRSTRWCATAFPADKPLKKGDIVNVDVTVITPDGWYGDNSRMFEIGEVLDRRQAPVRADLPRRCGWASTRCGPARAWATSATRSRNSSKARACRWCASSAATASARTSTKTRRCCTTAAPARVWSWSRA